MTDLLQNLAHGQREINRMNADIRMVIGMVLGYMDELWRNEVIGEIEVEFSQNEVHWHLGFGVFSFVIQCSRGNGEAVFSTEGSKVPPYFPHHTLCLYRTLPSFLTEIVKVCEPLREKLAPFLEAADFSNP